MLIKQQLLQMTYVSKASKDILQSDRPVSYHLNQIGAVARLNNSRIGVTGLLLYNGGTFLQVLEGRQNVVEKVFNRILLDSRHEQVQQLLTIPTARRMFAQWHMGVIDLQAECHFDGKLFDDAIHVLRYCDPIVKMPRRKQFSLSSKCFRMSTHGKGSF